MHVKIMIYLCCCGYSVMLCLDFDWCVCVWFSIVGSSLSNKATMAEMPAVNNNIGSVYMFRVAVESSLQTLSHM